MLRDSAVYKVLSPEKIPALNMGNNLSPMNNSNHPTLDIRGAAYLAEAVELMRHNLTQLLPIIPILKGNEIEHRSFLLALNTINSYIYILDTTLSLEKNKRVANYAYSNKASAK
ncbi:MAG: hypothetical protein Q8J82_08060 [Methylotenera sp.]|uniref:hypothetical protein n=1 Tax=Methylotenera sp. TaxID=2051956 RepID=UPI00273163F5|nr:hypothetical protein [Methylotenera sp.]MDP2071570.1 hypothetical protein [Methylotenera sp.]